jgi:hypothetical protein
VFKPVAIGCRAGGQRGEPDRSPASCANVDHVQSVFAVPISVAAGLTDADEAALSIYSLNRWSGWPVATDSAAFP